MSCTYWRFRPTLKNCFVSPTLQKKKSPGWLVKLFFTLFKLKIDFYAKCYLHHNCSVNLNWNNAQLYCSAKLLCNVPSCVFWFVNFVFFHFCAELAIRNGRKTGSVMYTMNRWERKVGKDIKEPVSKPVYRSHNLNIQYS